MASEKPQKSFDIPKTYKAAVYGRGIYKVSLESKTSDINPDDPGKIRIKINELETPSPGPGEVLIRLTVSSHGTFAASSNDPIALRSMPQ
jgi:propanol-preferring alcohol dehydrogenase